MLSHAAHTWATVIVLIVFTIGMFVIVALADRQPRRDDEDSTPQHRPEQAAPVPLAA